jgi:hypothetical protein
METGRVRLSFYKHCELPNSTSSFVSIRYQVSRQVIQKAYEGSASCATANPLLYTSMEVTTHLLLFNVKRKT